MTPVVEAHGIAKLYGSLVAVDDLTFAVEAGEVLGILGPNGAGKTTAVRMLTTILAPSRGSFSVAGIPHTRPAGDPAADRRAARERGLSRRPDRRGVPDLPRPPLRIPARPRPGASPARCSTSSGCSSAPARRSRPTAAACGSGSASPARSSTTPSPSSSTSRRSASIRRGSGRCSRTSGTIARERGAAVLLSTHLLNEVEENCSHVLILNRGRVIAEGTVSEVVSRAAAPQARASPGRARGGGAGGRRARRCARRAARRALRGPARLAHASSSPRAARSTVTHRSRTTPSARCSTTGSRCAPSSSTARASAMHSSR